MPVRTYLQLNTTADLQPVLSQPQVGEPVRFDPVLACDVERARAMYRDVGHAYGWHDRNAWSDEQYTERLQSPAVQLWVLAVGERFAGFTEFERHGDNSVEIVLFGLAAQFIGHGLGGWMLTRAVEEAWRMNATRVWLHTCTLDSPHALPNYLRRGFTPYRTEEY